LLDPDDHVAIRKLFNFGWDRKVYGVTLRCQSPVGNILIMSGGGIAGYR
jgi:hypothetical protein